MKTTTKSLEQKTEMAVELSTEVGMVPRRITAALFKSCSPSSGVFGSPPGDRETRLCMRDHLSPPAPAAAFLRPGETFHPRIWSRTDGLRRQFGSRPL